MLIDWLYLARSCRRLLEENPAARFAFGRSKSMNHLCAELSMTRVLVVDDEKIIADTLAMILRQFGYDVCVAYDGKGAVSMANLGAVDALISDVVMPHLNGIEAAQIISTMHPNCKVILFSGQATTVQLQQNAEQRTNAFEILAKPVPPGEILRLLGMATPSSVSTSERIGTTSRFLPE
jgi:CheY-like chemotaxis protein